MLRYLLSLRLRLLHLSKLHAVILPQRVHSRSIQVVLQNYTREHVSTVFSLLIRDPSAGDRNQPCIQMQIIAALIEPVE